jgi:hypothetical protein
VPALAFTWPVVALVVFGTLLSCSGLEHRNAAAWAPDPPARSARLDPGGGAGARPMTADGGARRCNGRSDLCDRPYDHVVFPAAHNAHAAREYGYSALGNQQRGFAAQLADGIRAFLIDAYHDRVGRRVLCHGVCAIASTRHIDALETIRHFLDTHRNEVLTFIYENHVRPRELAEDFQAAGLDSLAFLKEPTRPWPTLGEMIDAGTRIVVATEFRGPGPAWIHPVWDIASDTPYGVERPEDLGCAVHRGSPGNGLFLMNHWVNGALGLPSEHGARAVNTFERLYDRALHCAEQRGRVPNFLAVDFYEHGDLFDVVGALNDRSARGPL